MTLSIVTWKWRSKVGWIQYTAAHINHLHSQLMRFAGVPFKMFCITDDAAGLHPSVEVVPLDQMAGMVPDHTGTKYLRSCYQRLRLFSPDAERFFGDRIMQLDIDMVIVGDISHITARTEPFLIWRSHSKGGRYKLRNYALNTSLILMDAGARADIWQKFSADPEAIASAAYEDSWSGTDQAIIGYLSRDKEPPTFCKQDGIYSFRDDRKECWGNQLAEGVKIVSFHDRFNPANPALHRQCQWLHRAWRESSDVPVLPVGTQIPGAARQHPSADGAKELVASP